MPTGTHSKVWSSLALMNALMATRPSPPGRFSITTGLPQRSDRRWLTSRAVMSVPLAGPNGRMNFTVRCGKVWADAAAPLTIAISAAAMAVTRRGMALLPGLEPAS